MAITFNVYDSSQAPVSGQYFDVDAVASATDNLVTVTVTATYRRSDGSTSYYKESSGVLGKCTINGQVVQHKTDNVKVADYTSVFGNAAKSNQVAHISPTPTDAYNSNTYMEFWSGTTYTTTFTYEATSGGEIPWEVRFVPSEDGYNKQNLNNSNWIITGRIKVNPLNPPSSLGDKIKIYVNGQYISGKTYVFKDGAYVPGQAYMKTDTGYKEVR